jgi:hypothetical protein
LIFLCQNPGTELARRGTAKTSTEQNALMALRRFHGKRLLAALCAGLIALAPVQALAFSRLKDLIDVEGIRDNMLVGYGLVVGLNGSAIRSATRPSPSRA